MRAIDLSTKNASNVKGLTREERREKGKALRYRLPRLSHAEWHAPANRQNPIDLLIKSDQGRLPQLIPIRYGRMMQSPFTFYRGASAIMAADLVFLPKSDIYVQACGDCHLMNFGGLASPERRIIFDINDFDETLPAPWEWDVRRLTTSFVIAGRHNGFAKADALEVAVRCIESYHEHMETYSEMNPLDMWYDRIETKELLESLHSRKWKKWKEILQDHIDKESSRTVEEYDFPQLATVKNGKVMIKDSHPLIFHLSSLGLEQYHKVVLDIFSQYRKSLTDHHKAIVDRYEIKDFAVKVAGVGSVGFFCAILLLMTSDNDVLFLQVKEAQASVLEQYIGKSVYHNHDHRIVAGQKLMQSASDMFLGWTKGPSRDYYIRQLRDIKIKPRVEAFDEHAMSKYAEWCGWTLARAHAKSGDAVMISGYLGNSEEFDEAITNFALNYAEQNQKDYKVFVKAIGVGKIEVKNE